MIGQSGEVTVGIPGGERPGKVRVLVRGVWQYYLAYSTQPVPARTNVLVIDTRGPGQIDVEPWSLHT